MKKNLLILATAAIALVGCSQAEILKDDVSYNEKNIPFSFAAYSNKATKADNHNTLNFFYTTFKVWGWKSYDGTNWEDPAVFSDQTNEYFASNANGSAIYTAASGVLPGDEWGEYGHSTTAWDAGWYYEGIKYWDKFATNYQFCAYAPITASAKVVCTPDGVIKIGDNGTGASPKGTITVDTKNLMATPATELAYTGFDYDYMTAAVATSSAATTNVSPVPLVFTHELAKFNIKIVLNTKVTTTQTVTVNEVSIKNINGTSYYTNAEDVASPSAGYLSGWATPTTEIAYTANGVGSATAGYQINGDIDGDATTFTNYSGYFIMERLMIPQEIAKTDPASQLAEFDEPCIYVKYTIGSEEYTGHWGLANLFDNVAANTSVKILGGNEYTLTITVGPDPIYFTASVTPWAEHTGAFEF